MAASDLEGAPMPSLSGQQYLPKSRKRTKAGKQQSKQLLNLVMLDLVLAFPPSAAIFSSNAIVPSALCA